jgi:hypothetical protein
MKFGTGRVGELWKFDLCHDPHPVACPHHARALENAKNPPWLNLRAGQMVDDPHATHGKPKRKGGRPLRAEASAKALRGLDLTAIDPVAILRQIAADSSAPASARVQACRALLGVQGQPAERSGGDSRINERAIAMMMRRAN